MPTRPICRGDRGFTIIEVLIALLVLLIGLVSTLALVNAANGRSVATKGREGATNLSREVAEQVRMLNYSELTSALIPTKLQARPELADSSAAPGWQVSRRGFDYTIATAVCSIDSAGDGFGSHAAGFCPDSPTVGTADATPEDLKRVTLTMTFQDRGRTITTRTITTVNSTGQTSGLPVITLALHATNPATTITSTTEPTIGSAVTTVVFRATAPATAAKVLWNVEGQRKTPNATKIDATTWEFAWTITGVSDGTYGISAQAVDAKGEIGPPREIPVRLARNTPPAVTNLVGGYNTVFDAGTSRTAVEMEWEASPERNVEGYRVYRGDGSLACPANASIISAKTSCIDFSPPATSATPAQRTYRVHGLYRNAANTLTQTAAATRQADPVTWTTTSIVDEDRTMDFRLQNGTANTGTSCTGTTNRRDMLHATDGPAGTMVGGNATMMFCSPAFGADVLRILPSTATFKGYFTNVNDQCRVTVTLRKQNGAAITALGTPAWRVFNLSGTGEHALPAITVPETALVAGDRLTLTVAYNNQGGCMSMTFGYGLTSGYNHGRLNGPIIRFSKTVTNNHTSQPSPVTGLTATPQTDGSIKLTWNKPTTGPAIDFYRIYKNGQNHTDRLTTALVDLTPGATVDSELVNGGTATYRVTAVSPTLGESTMSAPVSVP